MHNLSKSIWPIVVAVLLSFLLWLDLLWAAQATAEKKSAPDAASAQPKAFFPATRWEFQPVIEGAEITHDFFVENHGGATLLIREVRPD